MSSASAHATCRKNYATADAKTVALAEIIDNIRQDKIHKVLVVGCGSGREAGVLARRWSAYTVGIDTGAQFAFQTAAAAPAQLRIMDAEALEFESDEFDLVYSFHALEHIKDSDQALAEMSRVLRPGGAFCIGTPNSHRLIGYLGSPVSIADKVRWNLADWHARLAGRWSNQAGAHAGFSEDELLAACRRAFGAGESVSAAYYAQLRPHALSTRLMNTMPIGKWLRPCCYIAGVATETDGMRCLDRRFLPDSGAGEKTARRLTGCVPAPYRPSSPAAS